MKAVRALLLSSESGEDLCSGLKEILQQHLPEQSILTTEPLPCRDGDSSYHVTLRPAVNRDLDILFIIMKQIERTRLRPRSGQSWLTRRSCRQFSSSSLATPLTCSNCSDLAYQIS